MNQIFDRGLSDDFLQALKIGHLKSITERIKNDHTLMFAIRKDYINIYYRGGSILKLSRKKSGYYAEFNKNYITNEVVIQLPEKLDNEKEVQEYLSLLPHLKDAMDLYFGQDGYSKLEREMQQIIVRENNFTELANSGEYFIVDIEYARTETNSRTDLLAFKWDANKRKTAKLTLSLIEFKYGDYSLKNNSGIMKHLDDMERLLDENYYSILCHTAKLQLIQLLELGLIKGNMDIPKIDEIKITPKPEVIFVFTNHNPRSNKLFSELVKIKESERYDLRFFISSFSGYTMHSKNMVARKEIINLLFNNTLIDKFKYFLESPVRFAKDGIWGGAKLIITDDMSYPERNDGIEVVKTKHAQEISALLRQIRDFVYERELIDCSNKIHFFCSLGNAIEKCLAEKPDASARLLCACVIYEANTMLRFNFNMKNPKCSNYIDTVMQFYQDEYINLSYI